VVSIRSASSTAPVRSSARSTAKLKGSYVVRLANRKRKAVVSIR
jgi:hypothetical protein